MQTAANIDATGADALCGIYALQRTDKPGTYIGQSVSLHTRGYDHKKELRRGKHRNSHLQRIFTKHGDVFAFKVLCCGFDPKDKDLLTLAEQEFMDVTRETLLNQAPAAGSMAGYKHSAETRARAIGKRRPRSPDYIISEAQHAASRATGGNKKGKRGPWSTTGIPADVRAKMMEGARLARIGKVSPLKGRKMSAEVRAKMSAALLGRVSPNKGVPRTAEQTAKQSATMKALHATPEHKAKMAAAKAASTYSPSAETRAKLKAAAVRRWAAYKEPN